MEMGNGLAVCKAAAQAEFLRARRRAAARSPESRMGWMLAESWYRLLFIRGVTGHA